MDTTTRLVKVIYPSNDGRNKVEEDYNMGRSNIDQLAGKANNYSGQISKLRSESGSNVDSNRVVIVIVIVIVIVVVVVVVVVIVIVVVVVFVLQLRIKWYRQSRSIFYWYRCGHALASESFDTSEIKQRRK
ncbi:hypothetical protein HZH68_013254 [Vespula germanica]|uniref:Uncharacterized protein n=1 Tax=Vespula germanica TaxID=30212 RepID=A0A834JDX9_VESGE|nr:hypothetical protein HZH68_013254 [Vespula germanica]